jgi:transposase
VVQSGKQCPPSLSSTKAEHDNCEVQTTPPKFQVCRDCRSLKALLLVDFFSKNFDPVDIKSFKLNIEVYRCDYSSETRRSTTVTSSSISAFRYKSTGGNQELF